MNVEKSAALPVVKTTIKILVCDDSEIVCEAAEMALSSAGFQVVTRTTPIGLSGFVRATKPDLIVLDVEMPGMTGGDACERIRRASPTSKILFFSSVRNLEQLCVTCRADAWLSKQTGVDALVLKVRQLTKGCLS